MGCPTCSYPLRDLGLSGDASEITCRVSWCARCGTLREELSDRAGAQTNDQPPLLVGRCRDFEERVPHGARVMPLWEQTGIAEAIYTPTERDR